MRDEFKRSGAGTMEQLARHWYDECPLVFRVEINAAGVSDGFNRSISSTGVAGNVLMETSDGNLDSRVRFLHAAHGPGSSRNG